MKSNLLIIAMLGLAILSKAQNADTVADKIAKLPYVKFEIYPEYIGENIGIYISDNLVRPQNLTGSFTVDIVVAMLIDTAGKIDKVTFIKNDSPEIGAEISRILTKTQWRPAIFNFEYVTYNQVLQLKINGDSATKNFNVTTYNNYFPHHYTSKTPIDSTNFIFTDVESEPSFSCGIEPLSLFLSRQIHYPVNAAKHKIQGKVFVTCVIEKDGGLTDFHVVRSPDLDLSLEALRVLKLSPKFSPCMHNKMPVRVQYTMPIIFKLDK